MKKILTDLTLMLIAAVCISSGCGSKDGNMKDASGDKPETVTESSDDTKEPETEVSEDGTESADPMFSENKDRDASDSSKDPGKVTHFIIPEEMKGTVEADLDADGNPDEIKYEKEAADYITEKLILTINGSENELTEGVYYYPDESLDCFWIRDDDTEKSQYLYIQQMAENDYITVAMFWYTEGDLVYLDVLDGAVAFRRYTDENNYEDITLTDPEDFLVRHMEQVLGTQFFTDRCCIDADGCPVSIDEYKYYLTGVEPHITTTTEIPAGYFEDEYSIEELPSALSEGWKVSPYRTDGSSFIDLKVDGREGIYRICYRWDDGELSIIDNNGSRDPVNLFDSFDGLDFAG